MMISKGGGQKRTYLANQSNIDPAISRVDSTQMQVFFATPPPPPPQPSTHLSRRSCRTRSRRASASDCWRRRRVFVFGAAVVAAHAVLDRQARRG